MANVGGIDRVARIVVGAALVGATAVGPWAEVLSPWGYIGVVPLLTGLVGYCPAYSLIGMNTSQAKSNAGAESGAG